MSTSDSYVFQHSAPESSIDQDEVDSLPSSIDDSDLESEDGSDAQKEWEASLQQLELLLTMVVVPYVGKYFGRKFAYWSEFHACCWRMITDYSRLGKIYGMDVRRRGPIHEQEYLHRDGSS
jgi:hypothetical protein